MPHLTADLDAVAHALDAGGVRHELVHHGERITTDCPCCGKTGRRGRRPVVVIRKLSALAAHADCGCTLVDIARALDLPPSFLLNYRKVQVPSTRDVEGRTNAREAERGLTADANAWGVSRTATKLRRGNL